MRRSRKQTSSLLIDQSGTPAMVASLTKCGSRLSSTESVTKHGRASLGSLHDNHLRPQTVRRSSARCGLMQRSIRSGNSGDDDHGVGSLALTFRFERLQHLGTGGPRN